MKATSFLKSKKFLGMYAHSSLKIPSQVLMIIQPWVLLAVERKGFHGQGGMGSNRKRVSGNGFKMSLPLIIAQKTWCAASDAGILPSLTFNQRLTNSFTGNGEIASQRRAGRGGAASSGGGYHWQGPEISPSLSSTKLKYTP